MNTIGRALSWVLVLLLIEDLRGEGGRVLWIDVGIYLENITALYYHISISIGN